MINFAADITSAAKAIMLSMLKFSIIAQPSFRQVILRGFCISKLANRSRSRPLRLLRFKNVNCFQWLYYTIIAEICQLLLKRAAKTYENQEFCNFF